MSLVIAAAAFLFSFHGGGAAPMPAPSTMAQDPAAESAARAWIALVDQAQWGETWDAAGSMFKAQVTRAEWAKTIESVRAPLGAASARVLQSATRSKSLPGAPDGDYEIVQFHTRYANRPESAETVVLAHEGARWTVVGYFIR